MASLFALLSFVFLGFGFMGPKSLAPITRVSKIFGTMFLTLAGICYIFGIVAWIFWAIVLISIMVLAFSARKEIKKYVNR